MYETHSGAPSEASGSAEDAGPNSGPAAVPSAPRGGSSCPWSGVTPNSNDVSAVNSAVKSTGAPEPPLLCRNSGTKPVWSMPASTVITPSQSGSPAASCRSKRQRPPELLCTTSSASARRNARVGAKQTRYTRGCPGALSRVLTATTCSAPSPSCGLALAGRYSSWVNSSSGLTDARPLRTISTIWQHGGGGESKDIVYGLWHKQGGSENVWGERGSIMRDRRLKRHK